ncbi:Glycosyltransferase [Tumidithrix helvetica PCC 7403]|uniref:hypothetical protein n=1 Tax=Tumidithrix helvetica TaxID=3457545 RepID=UPI003C9CB15D
MKILLWVAYEVLSICFLGIAILLAPVRFAAKRLMLKGSAANSLWTGAPIITLALKAKSEVLLGVNAKSLVYDTYFVTSNFDYNLKPWTSIPILGKLTSLFTFLWVCLWADRIHMYMDRGVLLSRKPLQSDFRELFVYKLLGISIFFWTYGADVRSRQTTQNLGEPNCCTECPSIGKACICDEQTRIQHLEKLKRYATAIFSMGDMIEYTAGSRNDLFFWPLDLFGAKAEKYQPVYPRKDSEKPIRIVHAPNHRAFKGTHFLVEAVERLTAQGVPVELVLVEKIANEQALEIYRSADIIFDQCLIGFHGYFALEGMAMGKPVMCYIRKPQEYLMHPEECPIVNTHINTLEQDIYQLVSDRDRLYEIGIKSRQYIEKYFTLEAFANRLKKNYEDLGISI